MIVITRAMDLQTAQLLESLNTCHLARSCWENSTFNSSRYFRAPPSCPEGVSTGLAIAVQAAVNYQAL